MSVLVFFVFCCLLFDRCARLRVRVFPPSCGVSSGTQATGPLVRMSSRNGYALAGTFREGIPGSEDSASIDCELTRRILGRDVVVPNDLAANLTHGRKVTAPIH